MIEKEKPNQTLVADVCTLIAFVSFVIVYVNLVVTTGIVSILSAGLGDLPPVRWVLLAVFYSPVLVAGRAIWEFTRALFQAVVDPYEKSAKLEFLDIVLMFGTFIGTLLFILVLSAFVAYQSHQYLTEVAPPIRTAIASFFGVGQ